MIEMHVGTRDVTNIRAHAQKFLQKLVKLLGKDEAATTNKGGDRGGVPHISALTSAGIGENDDQPLTDEQYTNAEIYYELLKQKMHKNYSRAHKKEQKKKNNEEAVLN